MEAKWHDKNVSENRHASSEIVLMYFVYYYVELLSIN